MYEYGVCYYVEDVFSILDVEYDCLMCELLELEVVYLELMSLDLFSLWVGGCLFDVFEFVVYEILMLLFDNVFDDGELESFYCCMMDWILVV